MIDEKMSKMLNEVFAWSQHISGEARKRKHDGIADDALIIQEIIENYLHDIDINPRDVIDYENVE